MILHKNYSKRGVKQSLLPVIRQVLFVYSNYEKKYPFILIIATFPAIKVAHDYAYDKNTLVMATRRTLESSIWKKLYNKQYHPKNTMVIACDGLANFIEEGKEKEKRFWEILRKLEKDM